jgi:sulfane dehydrogenase subunit SoxC
VHVQVPDATHPSRKPLPSKWFEPHGDNAEMRWDTLDRHGYLTPTERFFVRNQGTTPHVDPVTWRLRVEGPEVRRPFEIDLGGLLRLPAVSYIRALECAGNGRRFFTRDYGVAPLGNPWGLGAIGVAMWKGVRLSDLLQRAEPTERARYVLAEGLDDLRVARAIPLEKAFEEDTLIAFEMNGEPLTADHGGPARLLVPGWAAVASIKWVGRIAVTEERIRTRWDTELYSIVGGAHRIDEQGQGAPVEKQVVKSALQLPWPARLERGPQRIIGRAWSPNARIAKVEYRTHPDASWREARLILPNIRRAWVRFEIEWNATLGNHTISVKATNEWGDTQPELVPWNDHGYLYNAVIDHPVTVIE